MKEKRTTQPKAMLELGCVVITSGAKATLTTGEMICALARHVQGDWGILTKDDWEENEGALAREGRIFSVYEAVDGGDRYYVITEADRSSTCVLLPEEY